MLITVSLNALNPPQISIRARPLVFSVVLFFESIYVQVQNMGTCLSDGDCSCSAPEKHLPRP